MCINGCICVLSGKVSESVAEDGLFSCVLCMCEVVCAFFGFLGGSGSDPAVLHHPQLRPLQAGCP